MFDTNTLFDAFFTLLFLPLNLIFAPIDGLLSLIPGISVIPTALQAFVSYISDLPSMILYLFRINPVLWNILSTIFLTFFFVQPTISLVKLIWSWIRP